MKDNDVTRLSDAIRQLRMDDTVRADMRARLSSYADMHEVRSNVRTATPSFAGLFGPRALVGALVVVLLVSTSGGMAYASSDALPGDPLYRVKVSFAEPVAGTLITNPAKKAAWNAMLAERRLAEAITLASRGELSTESRTYLESRFAHFAQEAEAGASLVAVEGDPVTAFALRSDLEARLVAHADLVEYLAESEGAESERFELKTLVHGIARERDRVVANRQGAESLLASASVEATDELISSVEADLEEAENLALGAQETVQGGIGARISAAREAIAHAREIRGEKQADAYVATKAASRLSQEAKILVRNSNGLALAPARPLAKPANEEPGAKPVPVLARPIVDPSTTATLMIAATGTVDVASVPADESIASEPVKEDEPQNAKKKETSIEIDLGGVNISLPSL